MVREKTCAGVNGFRVFHAMRREPLGALAALRNLRYTPSLPFPFLQHPTTSERIKRFCCDCCASYGFDEQEMPPLSLLPPWIRLEDAFKTRNLDYSLANQLHYITADFDFQGPRDSDVNASSFPR
jgi:hypothetical protein